MNAKQYRLFRRGQTFYVEEIESGKQESLRTKDRKEAITLFAARNEAQRQVHLNLQLARTYLTATDPQMAKRTWEIVFEEITATKKGSTRARWITATKDPAYEGIWPVPLLETRAEHFLQVLKTGTVSTNIHLRRVHNFALDMSWIPWPIIPKRQWPRIEFKEKRAITAEEHQRIVAREGNPERRAFYELAWHLGAAQSDLASLHAEDVNWPERVITFHRKKTGSRAQIRFGPDAERILRELPSFGALFPYLATVRCNDRATEFKQRCKGLGITGVTLHSYRYSWAERGQKAGYPERYAQLALGQNSKAVHRAYAKKAQVTLPALEEFERAIAANVLAFPFKGDSPAESTGTVAG